MPFSKVHRENLSLGKPMLAGNPKSHTQKRCRSTQFGFPPSQPIANADSLSVWEGAGYVVGGCFFFMANEYPETRYLGLLRLSSTTRYAFMFAKGCSHVVFNTCFYASRIFCGFLLGWFYWKISYGESKFHFYVMLQF